MADFVDSAPAKSKEDGLCYKAKLGGSPFGSSTMGSNMSCLLWTKAGSTSASTARYPWLPDKSLASG